MKNKYELYERVTDNIRPEYVEELSEYILDEEEENMSKNNKIIFAAAIIIILILGIATRNIFVNRNKEDIAQTTTSFEETTTIEEEPAEYSIDQIHQDLGDSLFNTPGYDDVIGEDVYLRYDDHLYKGNIYKTDYDTAKINMYGSGSAVTNFYNVLSTTGYSFQKVAKFSEADEKYPAENGEITADFLEDTDAYIYADEYNSAIIVELEDKAAGKVYHLRAGKLVSYNEMLIDYLAGDVYLAGGTCKNKELFEKIYFLEPDEAVERLADKMIGAVSAENVPDYGELLIRADMSADDYLEIYEPGDAGVNNQILAVILRHSGEKTDYYMVYDLYNWGEINSVDDATDWALGCAKYYDLYGEMEDEDILDGIRIYDGRMTRVYDLVYEIILHNPEKFSDKYFSISFREGNCALAGYQLNIDNILTRNAE